MEIDHILPVAAGGDNATANLQAAHPECNRRKGITPPPASGLLGIQEVARRLNLTQNQVLSRLHTWRPGGLRGVVFGSGSGPIFVYVQDLAMVAPTCEAPVCEAPVLPARDFWSEPLLRPETVALRLNVDVATILTWLREGKLKGIRPGGRVWRVRASDLQQFIVDAA